jgi:hypothetical protein
MAHTVVTEFTRPSKEIAFFVMPQSHIDAVDQIISEMGDKHVESQISTVGVNNTITRRFIDEAAYQEFVAKTSANEDISRARSTRAEYNKIFGITSRTHVELN